MTSGAMRATMARMRPALTSCLPIAVLASACASAPPAAAPAPAEPPPVTAPAPAAARPPTFEDDVAFLKKHGTVELLQAPSGGQVALSSKYQGRVMTSAVEPGGQSLGWINRKFVAEGKVGTQFDNYGGEDRFWLGPEGGQYGLYFPPGAPFSFDKWQTPAGFQEGEWSVADMSRSSVTYTRLFRVTNYARTVFDVEVKRTIRLLPQAEVEAAVGAPIPGGVRWVAFESKNVITNRGQTAWTRDKGLPSVWILGMYVPSADTRTVVPFVTPGGAAGINDAYFGKVPAERLVVDEAAGVALFTCDGKHRSKIGVPPMWAKPTLGSYSASSRLLTVVSYDKPAAARDYVNSMWEMQKDPYAGDVVNSYNDGPTEPGKPPLGGFYEIETSSPAAALAAGASLTHVHRTMHFVGDPAALDGVAQKSLGVSVHKIAGAR